MLKTKKKDLVVAEHKRKTVASTVLPLLLKMGDFAERLASHPTGILLMAWMIGEAGILVANKRKAYDVKNDFFGLRRLASSGIVASSVVAPIASPVISGLARMIPGQENRP